MIEKQVEKLLRGGSNTATISVMADVCLHCGERLYSQESVRKFEEIRKKLEQQQTSDFERVGLAYQVV